MKVLTNNQYYSQIANVIREQNGTNNTYKPQQMVRALKDLFYEEVEGVPPITFQGIGENLLDYRIDGASGGVGDKTSNLLQNTASSQTINGVTFTVNNDGSVICNGTSSAVTSFAISIKLNSNINYVLSGSPKNGSRETYRLDLRTISYSVYKNTADNGDGINFTIEENGTYLVCIRIADNYTCNNLTFYPMIRLASIQDDTYEPYGYKVPVVINGKNLFDEIYTNIVVGWDVNYKSIFVGEGTFTLSTTCPKQDDGNATNLFFLSGNVSTGANSATNGVYNNHPVTVTSLNGYVTIGYRAQSYDPRNYTTMLNAGTTALPYEPFTEPTTTNIYLDEPISENESISLSDTNTNIPTIRGTNVLTVDTTVQPSNVYVKVRKESSHEAQIRQLYESVNAELTQYKAQYGELGGE